MVRIMALGLSLVPESMLPPDLRTDEWAARNKELESRLADYTQEERKTHQEMMRLLGAVIQETGDDFLGELYEKMGLGKHYSGQFFTPKNIAVMMAKMTCSPESARETIREKGFSSIADPTCGAGVMLMAAGKTLKEGGINVAEDILMVGQDIDWVAGLMCYIQLSVAGYAGYVCIGNSLTHPMAGNILDPVRTEGQEYYFTPAFFNETWMRRRLIARLVAETTAEIAV